MDLVFVLEYRFDRTPDGRVWTQTSFAYSFWENYLEVFDAIRIVARVRTVPELAPDWKRADGDQVSIVAVPYYIGPGQFLRNATAVTRAVQTAVTPLDAVMMRAPSHLANLLNPLLARTRHPYGVEVVGDPHVVFAPGVTGHPLRPFFRWWSTSQLKWQCAHACAVSYVTQHTLPLRYPSRQDVSAARPASSQEPIPLTDAVKESDAAIYVTYYTDGVLTDEDFAAVPPVRSVSSGHTIKLVTVGSLAQPYKGIDVLIDAVVVCVREGLDLALNVIGDGRYRSSLEAQAAALGVRDRVSFLGQLPAGVAVRAELDAADLFVLASRTEGLPKAMIEAMARGLPCIGSMVGGIPELLSPEDLVPPGDVNALAGKIREVVSAPARAKLMAERNLRNARAYHIDVVRERRLGMYRHVRQVTETWLRG